MDLSIPSNDPGKRSIDAAAGYRNGRFAILYRSAVRSFMKMNFTIVHEDGIYVDEIADLTQAAKINYEKTGSRPI